MTPNEHYIKKYTENTFRALHMRIKWSELVMEEGIESSSLGVKVYYLRVVQQQFGQLELM